MANDISVSSELLIPTGQCLRQTKVATLMFQNAADVDRHVAAVIAQRIRDNNQADDSNRTTTVLGLPTGSTPIGVYRELIRMHDEEDLDFANVVTFNLDEYWPIEPDSIHSYRRWMQETFFDHVNIDPKNIHIPQGNLAREDIEAFCDEYEHAIEKAGGIDIQLLGIGRTGHVGFNEPGSLSNSRTRLVTLNPVTRRCAAGGFFGEENVPQQAITMGVQTVLSADQVILIAMGEHKASIVQRAVEGDVTTGLPVSFLQKHDHALFTVDEAAAADLAAIRTPWLVGLVDWTPELEKRAVVWLAEACGKPLLKLDARDFMEHHLHDLVRECGPVESLRQRVFDELLDGICTRPGGEPRKPRPIIVFSPHPDDDVISMGGTLITLANHGHDVHIAYMTSGNIAVFDEDALRHVGYVSEFHHIFNLNAEQIETIERTIRQAVAKKKPGDPDIPEMLDVKALIRKTEATAAAEIAGVPVGKLHFLDLPFYRTGEVTKRPIGDDDVEIVADLLRKVEPAQIYVAGDLSDPHGTHRVCAQAILRALPEVETEGVKPEIWLYRGAWQDYQPHEIERAVPLSPEIMLQKKLAIFKHESQKDRALFPGHDEREFWVRAEERTKNTADRYNQLGLPEYYALEGFVRFAGQL